jgi:hypothetical protein
MEWKRWRDGLAAIPVRSLAGPLRRVRQDLVYDVLRFRPGESARIADRARRLAGWLTPMLFYLAAAIRAHHAVLGKRASGPFAYVVPLPVNLRPKGAEGGLFRTRVSMLWFHVPAELVEDLQSLLAALREQRHAAIRTHQIENGAAALDFARFVPARLYARMARRPLGGELCSFFFAWTDEFCPGLERFFGAPVESGFHSPSVPASPGSGLFLSQRGGCVTCTHVRQQGVLDPAELALFREQLRRDLTGA